MVDKYNFAQRLKQKNDRSGLQLSPVMKEAIEYAKRHGGYMLRFPGGFWAQEGWMPHSGPSWSTSTIEAIVKRGAGEYVEWKQGRSGNFPIKMKVTQ